MNNDLISRECLKEELTSGTRNIYEFVCLSRVLEKIDNAPTVERPQGEWITDIDNIPLCKNCREIALQRVYVRTPQLLEEVSMVKSNFCPNCGADMRKEAENEKK